MKKLLTLALAAAALVSVQADSFFRSDLDSVKAKSELTVKSDEMNITRQGWRKNKDDQKYTAVLITKQALGNDWQEITYTVTPSGNGDIKIDLAGKWAKEPAARGWILIDSAKVNGKLLPNGDFKKTWKDKKGKQIPHSFWISGKARYIPDGGIDGSPAILVNHDNRSYHTFKNAEAGKTYTFQFTVKAADAPAE